MYSNHGAAAAATQKRPVFPPEDFDELFGALRRLALRISLNILKDEDEAEDNAQDALLLAWKKLDTFEGRSTVQTWFIRIVMNAAYMRMRPLKVSRVDRFDEVVIQLDEGGKLRVSTLELVPGREPDVCDEYLRDERRRRFHAALQTLLSKLKDHEREAFTLRYLEGRTQEEAARHLGIPLATLKTRTYRARHHLQEGLRRLGFSREDLPL